jgi:hypothetical protein
MKVSAVFDNFRSSMRSYMDSVTTSVEKATDVNKQFSAFHERLLLIDLGTIGLSVTALTSVASKICDDWILEICGYRACGICMVPSALIRFYVQENHEHFLGRQSNAM